MQVSCFTLLIKLIIAVLFANIINNQIQSIGFDKTCTSFASLEFFSGWWL